MVVDFDIESSKSDFDDFAYNRNNFYVKDEVYSCLIEKECWIIIRTKVSVKYTAINKNISKKYYDWFNNIKQYKSLFFVIPRKSKLKEKLKECMFVCSPFLRALDKLNKIITNDKIIGTIKDAVKHPVVLQKNNLFNINFVENYAISKKIDGETCLIILTKKNIFCLLSGRALSFNFETPEIYW